jgi:hypothetical protein
MQCLSNHLHFITTDYFTREVNHPRNTKKQQQDLIFVAISMGDKGYSCTITVSFTLWDKGHAMYNVSFLLLHHQASSLALQ